ncbi:MAG: hypothetical protein COV48_13730 [Elusimicrobia bacterium CG11_big_fil_rev_8_21_14_0_20_64_6]|nr:MAG: hypothetical protein COV48_13730 [Elusimicrobia bacterium CG11_big_fil_rev_8_21_14_0_20_64_6]
MGVAAEVVFTALTASKRDRRLLGYSYVWMFPVYALLYPGFRLLLPLVGAWAWPLRAALYAVLIMIFELLTGLALRAAAGEAPWEPEYRGKRWAVLNLVRLDFFPAWAAGTLAFERAYRLIAG